VRHPPKPLVLIFSDQRLKNQERLIFVFRGFFSPLPGSMFLVGGSHCGCLSQPFVGRFGQPFQGFFKIGRGGLLLPFQTADVELIIFFDAFVAYFALPWDAGKPEKVRVVAFDEAGNEAAVPLPSVFKKDPDKHDSINLSEQFLQQKMPEFEQHYPEMKGTLLEKYLYVNNQVRQSNAQAIAKVCATTDPQQLWTDRFFRMPGAGRAGFADQRTYLHNGTAIDNQTHLGVDIASTERAEIRAANRGKVVFADYLGIYGNMIIIDHGQGVASLYSHLSSIETTVGTLVEKNQPIARSGTTGMAGGDHLHFSMLVHGIFVTPIEWWDQHWIDVNIKAAFNAP
jgi:murein DD-endopeptidase MepM/ murein hydrolase activator NlpD